MTTDTDTGNAGKVYTCPMHPEVTSDQPGKCPKCGMFLVPEETGSAQAHGAGCCKDETDTAGNCGGHHVKGDSGCCGGSGKHAHTIS